ncbi:hypothetical protein THAOC_33743 [Thalassiosira oceanica]|uniref:Uncharacterized protein n=1 Tax=Thalassiosira oceanica TaxID=159749 RepID=K0REM3_THAOC|nr:hypothetical protein THAOC_33743 [Thalassiosira oceanica]|eukprot:EJK47521.1 hypothetical protein THAOC_33743 [Thalassiosira oceanica]
MSPVTFEMQDALNKRFPEGHPNSQKTPKYTYSRHHAGAWWGRRGRTTAWLDLLAVTDGAEWRLRTGSGYLLQSNFCNISVFEDGEIVGVASVASSLEHARKPSASGKGFGASKKKKAKYSIEDKSYNLQSTLDESSAGDTHARMIDFFNAHNDWKPLFKYVVGPGGTLATPFLADVEHQSMHIWDMSTIEQRNPWRLLPSKPTEQSSLDVLSVFLDELQRSLLDIPLDSIITGENDMHFLEEGRRTIAVTRFHVLDDNHGFATETNGDNWQESLFKTCWSEMAHLMSQDEVDSGSLVLLPHLKDDVGIDCVKEFVEQKLIRPIHWLGRGSDWEIVAMQRGSVGVRLLYKLGAIPDLKDRDSGSDEEIEL